MYLSTSRRRKQRGIDEQSGSGAVVSAVWCRRGQRDRNLVGLIDVRSCGRTSGSSGGASTTRTGTKLAMEAAVALKISLAPDSESLWRRSWCEYSNKIYDKRGILHGILPGCSRCLTSEIPKDPMELHCAWDGARTSVIIMRGCSFTITVFQAYFGATESSDTRR
ncbi:hypothetical protein K438DRAFT_1763015 [Mycena galopus ATCC 62051]|nr:hypothetical protein K438DRAFT_1763015 [Mycena galopus ATCC 62051]